MEEFLVVIYGTGKLSPWDGPRIESQGKTEDQYSFTVGWELKL